MNYQKNSDIFCKVKIVLATISEMGKIVSNVITFMMLKTVNILHMYGEIREIIWMYQL